MKDNINNVLFIGNGFDLAHAEKEEDKIVLKEFVKSEIFRINNKGLYKKFCNLGCEKWSDFEAACLEIPYKKRKTLWTIIMTSFKEWFHQCDFINKYKEMKPLEKIRQLIEENNITVIISFNYTPTPLIYNFEENFLDSYSTRDKWNISNMKGKFTYLHRYDDKELPYILGNDKEKNITKQYSIQKWEKGAKNFDPKETVLNTIFESDQVNRIVFYGFAFGESDTFIASKVKSIKNKKKVVIYDKDTKKILENLGYKRKSKGLELREI